MDIFQCILCNNEHCNCENKVDRTITFITTHGLLKLCNDSCFNYVNCTYCSKLICSQCDYIIYCDKCKNHFCIDCKDTSEFKYCHTCNNIHCNDCENMLHCNECNTYNCIPCMQTFICEYCFLGVCELCSIDDLQVSRMVYKCSLCMEIKCTSCSDMQICGYCFEGVCKECSLSCSDKCQGIGVHCYLCIYNIKKCDICKSKFCEFCNVDCTICDLNICLDCFGNNKMDICKFCTWYKVKNTRNNLNTTLPIELVDLIGEFYLN